jgi:pseudouridine-5'-phosphate glycosidase
MAHQAKADLAKPAHVLVLAPEVRDALAAGKPVVALETAVVTHGLPRELMAFAHTRPEWPAWQAGKPANLALALFTAETVRKAGAFPATVGMLDGQLIVGMTADQVAQLAAAPSPRKLSARDLGPASADQSSGGTTVAATLVACRHAGIRVFATGGIGGVHRGWTARPDVSADLHALAATPTAVVSAGAKAILDLPATVEALDTLGVPVLGMGTKWFPRFTSSGDDRLRVQATVASAADAARACAAHWQFNATTGVLVANPPPEEFAIPAAELEAAIQAAEADARARGVLGERLTPHLLSHMAAATDGKSVLANIAVLAHNAGLAARLATHLAPFGQMKDQMPPPASCP